jgi:hypothetical protein
VEEETPPKQAGGGPFDERRRGNRRWRHLCSPQTDSRTSTSKSFLKCGRSRMTSCTFNASLAREWISCSMLWWMLQHRIVAQLAAKSLSLPTTSMAARARTGNNTSRFFCFLSFWFCHLSKDGQNLCLTTQARWSWRPVSDHCFVHTVLFKL